MALNQWLRDLGNDDSLWPSEYREVLPSAVNFEYDYLRALAKDGNVFGVLLQIRDVFETLMKIPCVMGMIIIDENDNEISKGYLEIMDGVLNKKGMTIGDWDMIAGLLRNKKYGFQLPVSLLRILNRTRSLYDEPIGPEEKNIKKWRNDTVGHGALRFENDRIYEEEVRDILNLLKEYFASEAASSYEHIYVQSGNTELRGDCFVPESKEQMILHAEGKTYNVSEYIVSRDDFCFYFNSYYINKKKVQYRSFLGNRERLESVSYFDALLNRIQQLKAEGKDIEQKMTVRSDEILLNEMLTKPSGYVRPQALIDLLSEKMNEMEKGTILIQMERGTGKTAFASKADGLHNSRSLIGRSFCRTYHLSNINLRGIRDFSNSLNFSFRHSFHAEDDIYSTREDIIPLDIFLDNPDRKLADFLNAYHSLYTDETTILILDGVDELRGEGEKIIAAIPAQEMLDDGVYIVLLSRFENEKTVSSPGVRMIRQASQKADSVIRIRRDDEMNIRVMKDFLKKEYPGCPDPSALIEKADFRFLYLKPYVLIRNRTDLDQNNETDFFRSYLDYLYSLYGTSARNQADEILSTVTLFPMITLDEYQEYLNLPQLTYKFIGILNDLMPLFHVRRGPDGNQYALADEAYRQYVSDHCPDALRNTASFFEQSLRDQLSAYLNTDVRKDSPDAALDSIYMKGYVTEKSLRFYGRNMISLYHISKGGDPLYSAELFVSLAVRLGIDEHAGSGYLKVIRDGMAEDMIAALYEGIRLEQSGRPGTDSLFCYLAEQTPQFLAGLKPVLSKMKSFKDLYEYVLGTLEEIPDSRRFWWIIEDAKLSDRVLDVFDRMNQTDALAEYTIAIRGSGCNYVRLLASGCLSENTRSQLITMQNEHIELVNNWKKEWDSTEAIRSRIRQATDKLDNPDTFSNAVGPIYQMYVTADICTFLIRYAGTEELHDDLSRFCHAYYQRLCKEAEPFALYRLFGVLDSTENFAFMLKMLFGDACADRLVEWADIFFEKHGNPSRDCSLAVLLLLQAMKEYEKLGNTDAIVRTAEKLVYEYDPLIFSETYNRQMYELMMSRTPDLKPEGLYTEAGIALLRLYDTLGLYEKRDRLYQSMCRIFKAVERYTSHSDLKEGKRNLRFFKLIGLQRELHLEEKLTEYAERIYNAKTAQITSFLESANISTDYSQLNRMIDDLMDYDFQMMDPLLAEKHADELLRLLYSVQDHSNADMKEIIEDETQYVKDVLSKNINGQQRYLNRLYEIRKDSLPLSGVYRFECSMLVSECELKIRNH